VGILNPVHTNIAIKTIPNKPNKNPNIDIHGAINQDRINKNNDPKNPMIPILK